jgi:hypothetical protein
MQRVVRIPLGYEINELGEKVLDLPDEPVPIIGRTQKLRTTRVRPDWKGKLGRRADQHVIQEKFCQVYATRGDLNGKECAIEAGYAHGSAARTACLLLKKPAIRERIQQIIASGVPCIVRLPLKQRQSLYANEFQMLFYTKMADLRAGLGSKYKEYLDERYNKQRFNRRERKEGHMTYRLHRRQATEYAMAICDAKYGQLSRKKKRWDKFTKKWVW